jgi:hypothetical protein
MVELVSTYITKITSIHTNKLPNILAGKKQNSSTWTFPSP